MSTTHTLVATIPYGDRDIGAEVECEIVFSFIKGAPSSPATRLDPLGDQGWPDEIELVRASRLCNGKPAPFYGAFADLEQRWLDDLAEAWLESPEGQAEAFAAVTADDEAALEWRDEQRAERTSIDDDLDAREQEPERD